MEVFGIPNAASEKCTCDISQSENGVEAGQSQLSMDDHDRDSIESGEDKIDLYNITGLNRSDCDTDSLESMSVTSSVVGDVQCLNKETSGAKTLTSASGSSISASSTISRTSSDVKSKCKNDQKDKPPNGHISNGLSRKTPPKKLFKNKTVDLSQIKAKTNSNFKSPRDVNKPITPSDRRNSESCIFQTVSESHGIRETRLSRARFEKCHEAHESHDCEGDDYLTPTQRKDNTIRDLKKEVKELKQALNNKAAELENERKEFERKLELIIAENGTDMVIAKSDIETLQQKNEDLQKSYQVSVNTVTMLEETVRELKEFIAEKDRQNDKVFLETYRKGQRSAMFERNEELERIAVSCDGSSITIKELIQKLLLTENELGKWQSLRRQESYDSASKPETEAEATLRFLKDAFYHYATDAKDNDFHLRAMIRILNFTEVQKKKIADSIVAKRLQKKSTI